VVDSLASDPVDTAGHIEVVVDMAAEHWAVEHTVAAHTLLCMAAAGDIVQATEYSWPVLPQQERRVGCRNWHRNGRREHSFVHS